MADVSKTCAVVILTSENQNGIIRNYTVRYRAVSAEGPLNTSTVIRKEASEYFETFIWNSKTNTVAALFFCEHDPFDNGKYSKNQLLRHPLDR